jgi:hypothetical protein
MALPNAWVFPRRLLKNGSRETTYLQDRLPGYWICFLKRRRYRRTSMDGSFIERKDTILNALI